jgi:acetyl-CoA carboxylase biotin carboxyl carrier protein
MANQNNTNDIFDVRRIRRLVELMQENDLSEFDIQQGDIRIHLKRGGVPMPVAAPPVVQVAPTITAAAVPVTPTEEKNIQWIKSPMVGTFYTASNPDAPPFIKVGDAVSPEKTVCLIEAMKVYNEIQAECSGKIVAVLAKNGESVEFGKPLFKVSAE